VTSATKRDRIAGYGARLVISGDSYSDALAASEQWAKDAGALGIHAYDQLETLLGQGTVALEFEQQAPDLDTLLVAVGGGGLIGGIAAWYSGRIRLIGVEPEAAPTLENALRAGRPVDTRAGGIAADSLGGGRVGDLMFPLAQAYVDRVALVSDEDILDSQRRLWDALRITAEPGGAAALASLLSGKYRPERDERVGVLVCGGNTASPKTPEKVG
jgi:threonine dehydratase